MKEETSVIKTSGALEARNGEKVIIEGVYTLYDPFPAQKGKSDEFIVQILLDGDEGPFLEPYWDKKSKRSMEEVAKFKNKKVKVSGVYHIEQPQQPGQPEDASTFGGSCISPVTDIALAE